MIKMAFSGKSIRMKEKEEITGKLNKDDLKIKSKDFFGV